MPCDLATLTDLTFGDFSVCSPFVVWVEWWVTPKILVSDQEPEVYKLLFLSACDKISAKNKKKHLETPRAI